MRLIAVLFITLIALSGVPASAATLHDEATDGDLIANPNFRKPQLGLLLERENRVFGDLDGGAAGDRQGPDEFDAFAFSTGSEMVIDVDVLMIDGAHLTMFLFEAVETLRRSIFRKAVSLAAGQMHRNVFGVLDAGAYEVGLAPTNNTGAVGYGLVVAVTPVPLDASGWLLLTGLCVLGAAAVLRRQPTSVQRANPLASFR